MIFFELVQLGEKVNDARKSINTARINYNSHDASKTFFLT